MSQEYSYDFDDSSDEEDASIRDCLDEIVDQINPEVHELHNFLQNNLFSRAANHGNFNITDRTKGSFLIPDNKIREFMRRLAKCIESGYSCMYSEAQLEYSGIMLDFDILQKAPTSSITTRFIDDLIDGIFSVMLELINLDNFLEDGGEVHFVILKRPEVTFSNEHQAYKDGIHILIPTVKIKRPLKKLLIEKLREKVVPRQFSKVQLAEGKQPEDVLDAASAYVPVFFFRNIADKKKKRPYELMSVMKYTRTYSSNKLTDVSDEFREPRLSQFLIWEFSINWEAHYKKDGQPLIKKQNFEVRKHYEASLEKYYSPVVSINNGAVDSEMALLCANDPDAMIISQLLESMSIERATKYPDWFLILRILAKTSTEYKVLARRFSERCAEKYSANEFEHKFWPMALQQRFQCNYGIATVYHYAKMDNPEEYAKIINQSIFHIIKENITNIILEGKLQNYNIAKILSYIFNGRFKYATPAGRIAYWYEFVLPGDKMRPGCKEVYKWRKWDKAYDCPPLEEYMSGALFKLIEKQARYFYDMLKKMREDPDGHEKEKLHRYELLFKNIKESGRKLLETRFKSDVLGQAQQLFIDIDFANQLDQAEETHSILGVANGILKLGKKTEFIRDFHPYPISRYTPIDYIEYNPYEEKTKEVYINLRNMFPDNESDSFEYLMYYMAASLDFRVKDALFMMVLGKGGNGKTTLMNVMTGILGLVENNGYAAKLPAQVWLTAMKGGDSPMPSLANLQFARFAFSSEFEENARLVLSVMKELTGSELIRVRRLHENGTTFMIKCLFVLLSNYDFEIDGNDDGTWRRIRRLVMKMKFVPEDKYDPSDPFQRVANPSIQKDWIQDGTVLSALLSILVHFYENLHNKYNGDLNKVPHDHIKYDTEMFRNTQDKINFYISNRVVFTLEEQEIPANDIISDYCIWHTRTYNRPAERRGLEDKFVNSRLCKYFSRNASFAILTNHKIVDENYTLLDGEKRYDIVSSFRKKKYRSEPPEKYYERKCREYDELKKVDSDAAPL